MNPSPAEITSPDYWQKMPRDIIAARVWAQSSYHYNNIERLIADYSRLAGELARVEGEVAALTRERDAARNEARAAGALIDTFVSVRTGYSPTPPAKEQQ